MLLLTTSIAFASDEICSRTESDLSDSLRIEQNRMAFKNAGGLFSGGVCWWHNRLQRSSFYLSSFYPDLPKPSKEEVYTILYHLRYMDQAVHIPGYSDFQTFTKDHQPAIQYVLNQWQRFDGFRNSQWIRGISGHSSLSPNAMQAQMHTVYKFHKESPAPVWLMAQIKGISSHSFLLVSMKSVENGFDLEVIDSNHPLVTGAVKYRFGDTFLREIGEKYTFVPYVGFQNDFRLIGSTLKSYCRNKDVLALERVLDGQIEVRN